VSLALACFWFVNRRGPWAWALQDCLSASICLLFLKTMRLPSLRVAAFLLFLMFFYDIFMVFISPLLFHSSVMMEVATAGQPSASSASGVCVRSEGERMPMLMMIPRFSSPLVSLRSGTAVDFAMLGLGDIVLPGLLLTLARRFDLTILHRAVASNVGVDPASHASQPLHGLGCGLGCGRCGGGCYWAAAAIAYAIGLAITLAANIYGVTFNGVQGQPALLYLVPCTVGAVFAVSACRNEVHQVWHGTLLNLPDHPKLGQASEPEVQPCTSCCCDEYYEYDANYVSQASVAEDAHKQL